METVFPVQTNSFFASFENAGGEETKLFPPLIISLSLTGKRNQVPDREVLLALIA